MPTFKKIATLAIVLFFAISCKKDNNTPAPPAGKKLQKISWNQALADTVNFTYDATGRLVKSEDSYTIETYTYSAAAVGIQEFRKSENRFVSDITGVLDNNGRMVSNTGNYSYNINLPYTEQTGFTYDADGYLVKIVRTAGISVQTYNMTIVDGDRTQVIYTKTNSGGYTQTTDFYTDKNDLSGIGAVPLSYGNNHNGLFGKTNKHLIKYEKLYQFNAPSPSWTRALAYTLDAGGYIQTVDYTGTWISTGIYTFK